MENGGPAPEGVTDKIYENTTTIKEYLIAEDLPNVLLPTMRITACSLISLYFSICQIIPILFRLISLK